MDFFSAKASPAVHIIVSSRNAIPFFLDVLQRRNVSSKILVSHGHPRALAPPTHKFGRVHEKKPRLPYCRDLFSFWALLVFSAGAFSNFHDGSRQSSSPPRRTFYLAILLIFDDSSPEFSLSINYRSPPPSSAQLSLFFSTGPSFIFIYRDPPPQSLLFFLCAIWLSFSPAQ